jgi:hypothetical protein
MFCDENQIIAFEEGEPPPFHCASNLEDCISNLAKLDCGLNQSPTVMVGERKRKTVKS